MFIDYLLKNNIANKLYALGFVFAIIAYSFWQRVESMLKFTEENEGSVHFLCVALAFLCYTSAYMFTKWNKWRWFPMFVVLICFGSVCREIYFIKYPLEDPEQYSIVDYINFLLTIWIMFNSYVKYRLKKYKNEKK